MPEIVIVRSNKYKDRPWTFTVDGVPSLYFTRELTPEEIAKDPANLHPAYLVERVVNRLKKGMSREAFGGPVVVMASGDTVKVGTQAGRGKVFQDKAPVMSSVTVSKSGKEKARETQPGWKYELDGKESDETFATEAAAKAACALAAFVSRGKLGKLAEAKAQLEAENPGKKCSVHVCPHKHRIVATVEEQEYHVGFDPDAVGLKVTFKPKV